MWNIRNVYADHTFRESPYVTVPATILLTVFATRGSRVSLRRADSTLAVSLPINDRVLCSLHPILKGEYCIVWHVTFNIVVNLAGFTAIYHNFTGEKDREQTPVCKQP